MFCKCNFKTIELHYNELKIIQNKSKQFVNKKKLR